MEKLALLWQRHKLGKWALILLMLSLCLLPLPRLGHEWCKDAPAFIE